MPITETEWNALLRHRGHEGVEVTAKGVVCWECQNEVLVPLRFSADGNLPRRRSPVMRLGVLGRRFP